VTTGTAAEAKTYDLVESLRIYRWLRLPLAVMQDVGPAVQTLGGLLDITRRETFASVATVASRAWLPTATVRKHLGTLAEHGWINNAGREHTRGGAPRRTCTLRVTKKTSDAITPYAVLPWWATTRPTRGKRLSWASRAVLSIIMSRLMDCLAAIDEADGKAELHVDELWGSLANLNGDDRRWLFSLASLSDQTGLDHKSVTAAKRDLHRRGIIRWTRFQNEDGGDAKHALEPREDFRVRVTPMEREGYCWVDWLNNS